MSKETQFFILVVCLIFFADLANCERQWQIHQLGENAIMDMKEHHKFESANLRSHDRMSSSENSLMSGLLGFIFGPVMFFTAFICLWFNEKRAVIDHRRLKLAQQICVQVNPLRRDEITSANMKLTHISGNTTTNETIRDGLSNVMANGAIKLLRKVQVMEWRATTTERNGRTEVDYHLGWHTDNIPSVEGRTNPQSNWFVKPQTIYNQSVRVGEYLLSKTQKDQCKKSNQIYLDMNNANMIAANTHRNVRPIIEGDYVYFPSPMNNSINDHGALRIAYSYCPIGPITLMAKSVQNSFEPFPIASYEGNGKVERNELPACCCISNCVAQLLKPIEEIDLVEEEIMSKSQIVELAVKKSKMLTWILRCVTYLMMVFGICMFFSPITTLLGFIPLVGGMLKGTVGLVILLAALIVCIPMWIIAFSLAWLWYHPKVGAIFLGIGLAILGVILFINYSSQTGSSQSSEISSQTTQHLLRIWTS